MVKSDGVVSFTFNFIRRNFFLLLIIIISGNLIIFFKNKDSKPHFETSIKIHSRTVYYDHLKDLCNRISDSTFYRSQNLLLLSEAENNSLHSIAIQSYRNEDLYVYELKLIYNDTINWKTIKQKLYDYLENKTELKEIYFLPAENILNLSKQIASAERALNGNDTTAGNDKNIVHLTREK